MCLNVQQEATKKHSCFVFLYWLIFTFTITVTGVAKTFYFVFWLLVPDVQRVSESSGRKIKLLPEICGAGSSSSWLSSPVFVFPPGLWYVAVWEKPAGPCPSAAGSLEKLCSASLQKPAWMAGTHWCKEPRNHKVLKHRVSHLCGNLMFCRFSGGRDDSTKLV